MCSDTSQALFPKSHFGVWLRYMRPNQIPIAIPLEGAGYRGQALPKRHRRNLLTAIFGKKNNKRSGGEFKARVVDTFQTLPLSATKDLNQRVSSVTCPIRINVELLRIESKHPSSLPNLWLFKAIVFALVTCFRFFIWPSLVILEWDINQKLKRNHRKLKQKLKMMYIKIKLTWPKLSMWPNNPMACNKSQNKNSKLSKQGWVLYMQWVIHALPHISLQRNVMN